jgi:hypothetical protein
MGRSSTELSKRNHVQVHTLSCVNIPSKVRKDQEGGGSTDINSNAKVKRIGSETGTARNVHLKLRM